MIPDNEFPQVVKELDYIFDAFGQIAGDSRPKRVLTFLRLIDNYGFENIKPLLENITKRTLLWNKMTMTLNFRRQVAERRGYQNAVRLRLTHKQLDRIKIPRDANYLTAKDREFLVKREI